MKRSSSSSRSPKDAVADPSASAGKNEHRVFSSTAWFDHIKGNPLNLPPAEISYPKLADMADKQKEKYQMYGEKVSKHYSRHYALDEKWLGRIHQKLGMSPQLIHPPPLLKKVDTDLQHGSDVSVGSAGTDTNTSASWAIIKSFQAYLDVHYPGINKEEERNLVIIKHYKTGDDCMGEHSDGRSCHGTPIASLSLGATRRIIIRPKKVVEKGRLVRPKEPKAMTLFLSHGDVFVMCGPRFQVDYTHELPADKQVKEGRVGVVIRARQVDGADQDSREKPDRRKRQNASSCPKKDASKKPAAGLTKKKSAAASKITLKKKPAAALIKRKSPK
eukprot:TRINITY_DN10359_c0_g5_i1.p1 TRINITY_DN10359_c0_g5~~TRINITY_DN10359_c0_g5_i1.p1  ORF type:complete len:331 (-),score=56.47 TRINITY_DN10359_c0_g5_i1:727-1719(-)